LRELFERDHLRETIWEGGLFEKERGAEEKYLIRRDGTEYWESWDIKREQIEEFHWLKFLASVPSVSIFCPVSPYQIFLPRSLPSQMILPLKWSSPSNDPRLIAELDFGHVGQSDSIQISGQTWFFVRRVESNLICCSTFEFDSYRFFEILD
jgi:hypothetical protein